MFQKAGKQRYSAFYPQQIPAAQRLKRLIQTVSGRNVTVSLGEAPLKFFLRLR